MKQLLSYRISRRSNLANAILFSAALTAAVVVGSAQANKPDAKKSDEHRPIAGATASLHFIVDNIASVDGPIMVQVLAGEAAFKGEAKPIASFILPAQRGSIGVQLDGFPAGEYAIRVMHDVDRDGELKTNMLGMPKEPWGVSNNAAGSFGPPTWGDARFSVPSQSPQTITLRQ